MKRLLLIMGTRPEGIKLAPLYWELKNYPKEFETKICITAQHRKMIDQVLKFFNINPDYDLNLMKKNQSLFDITSKGLLKLEKVLEDFKPDAVIVQGDTTTAFVGALSAFYKKIKIIHVEAGLRSGNKYSPYPEEINRILIGHIADYHFVPTEKAKINLYNEGIKENVWVVGNTVIDALFLGLRIIEENLELKKKIEYFFSPIFKYNKKIILVTAHRRESFGEELENICNAIKELSNIRSDIIIVYPVHFNPKVRETVNRILGNLKNVFLIEPLDYPYFIYLMSKCYLILTDSGGVQEEGPSLGKPVLVMREVTERTEGIHNGIARLIGTKKENIVKEVVHLLENQNEYEKLSKQKNLYGDGKASKKIVEIIQKL